MKTRISAFICVLVLMLIAACTYNPVEFQAELDSLSVFPKYFCSGQTVLISFEGKFADKVQINKSNGDLLLEMLSPPQPPDEFGPWYGSGTTPPMRKEWLPLSIVVHSDILNKDFTIPFPGHKLINIDQQGWAGIYHSSEELLIGLPYNEHVASSQEYDSETDSMITVPHNDIKQDFNGFRWNIPYEHSSRATIVKIVNWGQRTMTFTINGIPGEFRLNPGQESAEFQVFTHPSGVIEARYDPPEPRTIARETGTYTKPANEHYSRTEVYEMHVSAISLLIRCGDE